MREPGEGGEGREQATREALAGCVALVGRLLGRGEAPREVASFVARLMVCMLAAPEEVRGGLEAEGLGRVFAEVGGRLGGGVFARGGMLVLTSEDRGVLAGMVDIGWGEVEPAVLGALFERGLEPGRRGQRGAHYTDRGSVLRVIEPVMMAPLRAEQVRMQAQVEALLGAGERAGAQGLFDGFLGRLRGVRVLDPACGAGNFLYVALQCLMALEMEVIEWGARRLARVEAPEVGAQAVIGLELEAEAAALARMTVWVGELQFRRGCGRGGGPEEIARIEDRDALLDARTGSGRADWPEAEFIVGNPPFLGGKRLRAALGDAYVERLFRAWAEAVPRGADLAVYWHEQARAMIAQGRCRRAGLLATQAIRGGANREVLRRIKASGDIFVAWSDERWAMEGAAVRVSMVGQDDGSESTRTLDGASVGEIYADLSGGGGGVDVRRARRLRENLGVAFMGDTKGGRFEVDAGQAAVMRAAHNADGRGNEEVVVPWVNGLDVTGRARGMSIVDFGVDMPASEAALYALPFAHVKREVAPVRAGNRRARYRERWWIHVEARPGLRAALAGLERFVVTPTVAKHRLFAWLRPPTLPDHQLIVLARADGYCFGVLHSRVHALWSLRMCTWLGAGNDPRYTPTTTFETFPFPWPLDLRQELLTAAQRGHQAAISGAAEALDGLRAGWLAAAEVSPQERGRRSLTRLYNARPGWLMEAHARLDAAVLAAYGWGAEEGEEALLERLLALNLGRPAAREGRSGGG